jgi:hypothetical protein
LLWQFLLSLQHLGNASRILLASAWAKTVTNWAGELPQILFAQKQLHFVLLEALKAINASEFTQSFS